jgi:hypothetical protein
MPITKNKILNRLIAGPVSDLDDCINLTDTTHKLSIFMFTKHFHVLYHESNISLEFRLRRPLQNQFYGDRYMSYDKANVSLFYDSATLSLVEAKVFFNSAVITREFSIYLSKWMLSLNYTTTIHSAIESFLANMAAL